MAENEIEGTDYSVAARDAGSALLVMAPHGAGSSRASVKLSRLLQRALRFIYWKD